MKLRNLNGAIRNATKARIYAQVGGLVRLKIVVEKGSLIEQLAEAFPEGGETGLYIDADGFLARESEKETADA